MSVSELRSGGVFDSPEIAAARSRGVFWAAEFACPVLLADFPSLDEKPAPKSAPKFLGSATLLGGDLFLSARHVFFEPDGTPLYGPRGANESGSMQGSALAITRMKERSDIGIAAIDWIEAHPDRGCDLVIGKLVQWDATPPWDGVVSPAALNDVTAVGYPYNRMAVLNTGEVDTLHAAVNSPRYLQGYVTRGVEVLHDPFMSPYSFEVSFSLTEGMSGCPLWFYKDNRRFLYGIASGSLSQTRPTNREERTEADGSRGL